MPGTIAAFLQIANHTSQIVNRKSFCTGLGFGKLLHHILKHGENLPDQKDLRRTIDDLRFPDVFSVAKSEESSIISIKN